MANLAPIPTIRKPLNRKKISEIIPEGGGDMLVSVYDPTSVAADAFDMDNMVDGLTYVKTENNYTDAEVSKLGGIASGAEVNVNPDWTALSGDAEILNKPTIPVVSDDAYDVSTWDSNLDAPSKNAVRDKFESLASIFEAGFNIGIVTFEESYNVGANSIVYIKIDGEDTGNPLIIFEIAEAGTIAYVKLTAINAGSSVTLDFGGELDWDYITSSGRPNIVITEADVNFSALFISDGSHWYQVSEYPAAVIDDTVYGVSWDNNNDGATKNAIYDKIETLSGGSTPTSWESIIKGTIMITLAAADYIAGVGSVASATYIYCFRNGTKCRN